MGKTIGIIGGAGKMGRWLTGLLLEDGFRLVIADADEKNLKEAGNQSGVTVARDNLEALSESDYILLSVPIESFEDVVREIGPRVRSEQVVIDITSTKVQPVAIMHRHVKSGLVLGAHPLFGPGAASI
ncbi:MAG: prephenate dehydrogenase/arogenate dehydrogenase family protein, partial [Dehalococcoidia bacterium]